jgi:hypothetical protein
MGGSRGDNYSSGSAVSYRGRAQSGSSRSRSAPAVFRDGRTTGHTTSVVRSKDRRAGTVSLVGMPWRWPVASLSTATALCDAPVSDPRAVYALPTRTVTFGSGYSGFAILPPCAQSRAALLDRPNWCRTVLQRGWIGGDGVHIPAYYAPWLAYIS